MSAPPVMGSVINVHTLGATVRLEDGRLAAVSLADLEAHRTSYLRSLTARKRLPLLVREHGSHRSAVLATSLEEPATPVPTAQPVQLVDEVF